MEAKSNYGPCVKMKMMVNEPSIYFYYLWLEMILLYLYLLYVIELYNEFSEFKGIIAMIDDDIVECWALKGINYSLLKMYICYQ